MKTPNPTVTRAPGRILLLSLILCALTCAETAVAYYDPGTQRWINRDPLAEQGFELLRGHEPDMLDDEPNLYTFVRNNSIQRIDRYGLSWGGFGFFRWCAMGRCISKVNKWAKDCQKTIPTEPPDDVEVWDYIAWADKRMEAIAACMDAAKAAIKACQAGVNFVPPTKFPWKDVLFPPKGIIDLPVSSATGSEFRTPPGAGAPLTEW
jgi:RHS repeat-associated protein